MLGKVHETKYILTQIFLLHFNNLYTTVEQCTYLMFLYLWWFFGSLKTYPAGPLIFGIYLGIVSISTLLQALTL